MKLQLTDEQKDSLSYDDVAYLVLQEVNGQIKIQELFKKVIELLGLPVSTYENGIGDFFEQMVTDKRFIMLDGGFCDLKVNHSTKMIIDDEDEFEIVPEEEEEMPLDEEEDGEDNYDEDANPDDTDDDLDDLVVIDENDALEEADMM